MGFLQNPATWGFITPFFAALFLVRVIDSAAVGITRQRLLWFIWGTAVAFLTLIVETYVWRLVEPFIVPAAKDFIEAFVLAGFTEELCKIALIYSIAKEANLSDRSSIIAAALMVGGGFAGAENVVYVLTNDEAGIVVARLLTAVPFHIANAVIGAHFVHRALMRAEKHDEQLALALFVCVLLHGLYDYLILADTQQGGKFVFALVLVITIAFRLVRVK